MAERDSFDRERALAAVNALRASLPETEGDWEFDPSELTLSGDSVGLLRLAANIGSQALEPVEDEFGTHTLSLSDDETPLFVTVRSPEDLQTEPAAPKGFVWGCSIAGFLLALALGYVLVLGLIQLYRQFFG